jgi:hypothetical protein
MKRMTADQAAKTRSRCWIGLARSTPAGAPDRHRIADYYPRSGQPRRQPRFPDALLAALVIRGRGAPFGDASSYDQPHRSTDAVLNEETNIPWIDASRSRTSLANNCAVVAVGIGCMPSRDGGGGERAASSSGI